MFQSLDSRKLIWISVSILVLMGFRWLTKLNNPYHFKDQSAGFSYEMPRVSSYGNDFDLSGREIDRQIMSDEEKMEAAGKKAAETKKEEEKKKAEQKKKDDAKKAAEQKKSKSLKTEVVNTKNDGSTLSDSNSQSDGSVESAARAFVQASLPNDKNQKQSNQQDKKEDKKKSATEWQELLMKDPSSANLTEFMKAKTDGNISDMDFYTVSLNMFKDTVQSVSEAGLQLLQKTQSAVGFEQMALAYGQVDQQRRDQLWRVLLSYSLPNRVQYLSVAMLDQNDGVVQLALQVLKYAVGKNTTNNQNGASTQTVAVGPGSLRMFIQPLEIIVQQQTPNSDLAKGILADIKSILKM